MTFQHGDFPALSPLSSSLSLLSRLESVGFWLADWPTDADLLNLRKHSETPERCPILWHVFPLQAHFVPVWVYCRTGAEGNQVTKSSVSDPSAEGRRAQLDCVHT